MGEPTASVPGAARPMRQYVAELERLPDGSLRACLYRDGQCLHWEWVGSERRGRRRVVDLICTAIDVDPMTPGRPSVRGPRRHRR